MAYPIKILKRSLPFSSELIILMWCHLDSCLLCRSGETYLSFTIYNSEGIYFQIPVLSLFWILLQTCLRENIDLIYPSIHHPSIYRGSKIVTLCSRNCYFYFSFTTAAGGYPVDTLSAINDEQVEFDMPHQDITIAFFKWNLALF